MKLKKINEIKLKIIACFCLMYIMNLPEVVKYSDPEILFKTNVLIILDTFVVSCVSTFIPCIHFLNKGEKMEHEVGKKVCFYNSLAILTIGLLSSIFLVDIYGYYYIVATILGSIIFYFVNILMFVEYKPKNNVVTNIIESIIILASVLIILFIGINYVRSTVDPPNYRIEDMRLINETR